MQRLFIALNLPELGRDALSQLQWGLDDALWHDPDGLHLTLAFLGDIDPPTLEDIIIDLSALEAPAFSLSLSGVDSFGGHEPRTLWVGTKACPALERLQKKISQCLRAHGHVPGRRKFMPHVTLGSVYRVEPASVHRFAASHGLFQFGPFPVKAFHIYESLRGKLDTRYEIVASFGLVGAQEESDAVVRFGQARDL